MIAKYAFDIKGKVRDTECVLIEAPDSTAVGYLLCSLTKVDDSAQLDATI